MEKVFRNFYRNFYLNTGGYMPTSLLNQNIYPGDFFQIQNGEMLILGNIFRDNILDPADCIFHGPAKLNAAGWRFISGVTKPYSGRSTGGGMSGEELEYSKQVLAFAGFGSFIFRGDEPESIRIMNWGDLQQVLTIRLTQTVYSFRSVYLATEVATSSAWTLAVASSDRGELEIATQSESFGLVDLFGHVSARTIQSKDIDFYHREHARKPCFFKAKKLVVQDESVDTFTSELITRRTGQDQWASDFFNYEFSSRQLNSVQIPSAAQPSILDMLRANELNANTALRYFKWTDANLDDLEKLFVSYAE